MNSDIGSYLFNYFIYIFIALIFAGVAGLYVTALAPYASGSGIPEVTFSTHNYRCYSHLYMYMQASLFYNVCDLSTVEKVHLCTSSLISFL